MDVIKENSVSNDQKKTTNGVNIMFSIGSSLYIGMLIALFCNFKSLLSILIISILLITSIILMKVSINKAQEINKLFMAVIFSIFLYLYCLLFILLALSSSSVLMIWIFLAIIILLNFLIFQTALSVKSKAKYLINISIVLFQIILIYSILVN